MHSILSATAESNSQWTAVHLAVQLAAAAKAAQCCIIAALNAALSTAAAHINMGGAVLLIC
jgi:hypothetical protein